MREIRTSGLMSGDGRRSDLNVETAPVLDSTSLMIPSERDARGPEEHDENYSETSPDSTGTQLPPTLARMPSAARRAVHSRRLGRPISTPCATS